MDIRFWSDDSHPDGLIGTRTIIPREGPVDVPEGTHRITLTATVGDPQVWLLSVDGRREECAWDSGDWPVCPNGVRVLVVAEYSDGRVLTRTFCPDHGQTWAEGLTLHVAVHDMRYREDVPEVPSRTHPIHPGAVGYGTVLIHDGRKLRVVRYTHHTDGSLTVWAHEQFTSGGEGPQERIHLGKPEHLYVPID
jgi:hypothetical protein